jgi:hypothetical protein
VVAHAYILDRSDVLKGAALAVWVLGCDAALKAVARLGGCGDQYLIDGKLASGLWTAPESCTGTDMAGASIRLIPHAHDGALLGLASGFEGVMGQTYALGLLFAATVLTILVVRWQWQANGDPQALGAVWGGALAIALPRLMGDGTGLAELELFGLSAGVGDLALIWGLLWLTWRFVGELRA